MKNHFSWLDLKASIATDQCPVCTMITKRTNQKIEAFQYAHVSDVEFRKTFIESDGFCQHHSERFFDKGDHLNHAILYHHLLKVKRTRYAQHNIFRRPRRKPCLFCEHERVSEKLYVNLFFEALNHPEFHGLYKEKGVVCTTHFDAVMKRLRKKKSPHTKTFEATTLDKYAAYQHDLAEIKRKNDYKHAEERLNEQERNTWQIARKLLIDQGMHRR